MLKLFLLHDLGTSEENERETAFGISVYLMHKERRTFLQWKEMEESWKGICSQNDPVKTNATKSMKLFLELILI